MNLIQTPRMHLLSLCNLKFGSCMLNLSRQPQAFVRSAS